MTTLGLFGGVYSNAHALRAVIADSAARRDSRLWCLGDLGGFGPDPETCADLVREHDIPMLQGNYDHSIGHSLGDCACGYSDPRDVHFAQLSYDLTFDRVAPDTRAWLRSLPQQARLEVEGRRVLLCHGSPRRVNEFLWDSACSDAFLSWLCDTYEADVIACSHTGLHWHRELPGDRHVVNVGAIGRPANDGRTCVWYAGLEFAANGRLVVEFRDVAYEHEALARQMKKERLPAEFIETLVTGWWTTCLENVPARERLRREL